ncbi:hypothetical protein BJY04DRAFT_224507 [Aspergillus karnatakaensis]|uniref:uncharacterized protein n=1 Tax=Aspergillus karnatakaensis TaxID=1810916 RepID=UPI003CCD3068
MFPQVERIFASSSRMDIRIHLCREPAVYTNEDELAGHVILKTESQVDVSTISIKLAGTAASRLQLAGLTETHQLFKTTEQLFPPTQCAGSFNSRSVTIPRGEHAFAFCLKFPHASQCYKSTNLAGKQSSARRAHHLLRRLPPSSGDKRSPEEIKYTLEAAVRQDGLIDGTHKAIRDIYLQTLSTIAFPLHGQNVLTDTKRITCSADSSSEFLSLPSTCSVRARLLNGPYLLLGQPISLAVDVMDLNNRSADISLHDFQSMLLETTEVRARGSAEILTRSCVVQTMANLRQPLVPSRNHEMEGLVLSLDEKLWSRHRVPLFLTPTFETCNIGRSYKLEIRLGIGFGGHNVRIVEFQFAVYVVSLPLDRDFGEDDEEDECKDEDEDEDEVPAPAYCEKEFMV